MTGGGEVGERAISRGQQLLTLQETDEEIAQLETEIAVLEAALAGDIELDRLRAAERAAEAERQEAEERCRGVERDLSGVSPAGPQPGAAPLRRLGAQSAGSPRHAARPGGAQAAAR